MSTQSLLIEKKHGGSSNPNYKHSSRKWDFMSTDIEETPVPSYKRPLSIPQSGNHSTLASSSSERMSQFKVPITPRPGILSHDQEYQLLYYPTFGVVPANQISPFKVPTSGFGVPAITEDHSLIMPQLRLPDRRSQDTSWYATTPLPALALSAVQRSHPARTPRRLWWLYIGLLIVTESAFLGAVFFFPNILQWVILCVPAGSLLGWILSLICSRHRFSPYHRKHTFTSLHDTTDSYLAAIRFWPRERNR